MRSLFFTINILMIVGSVSSCQTVDRGSFGTFDRSLNNTFHGYKIIEDPTGNAPTATIERFEVRFGDCSSDDGWNDCSKDRERSELSQKGDRNHVGSTYWYGWSIFFPNDYKNIYPTKVALGQFHQERSHPVWMFQNGRGGYSLDDQVFGMTRKIYELIEEDDLRGKWHRIEVHAKWSKDNSGFFKVWVNGVQKVDYQGQTMTATKTYFKYGVYRSYLKRYLNHKSGRDSVPGQVAYFANVRRGSSREDLLPAKK